MFRHLHSSSSPKAGPSQRELRAQLRAQRAEQSKIGRPVSGINGVPEAADVTELEAAASLVDLMAHEALPESGILTNLAAHFKTIGHCCICYTRCVHVWLLAECCTKVFFKPETNSHMHQQTLPFILNCLQDMTTRALKLVKTPAAR